MEFLAMILGWLVAVGLGIGWWIDHRGIAGIRSDLADAKREADTLKAKASNTAKKL